LHADIRAWRDRFSRHRLMDECHNGGDGARNLSHENLELGRSSSLVVDVLAGNALSFPL